MADSRDAARDAFDDAFFRRNVPGLRERLVRCRVAIAGAGGLGSNCAEALVRAGVGRLILADHDRVELSNLNRQAFFHDQAGLSKVEALAANLRRIHPRVDLDLNEIRLDRDNLIEVMGGADLLVEALDDARAKAEIIETWMRSCPGKPVVGASGLAGYGASDAIGITRMGRLVVVGDGTRDCSEGLCAGRVMAVAALQANEAIALLMGCGDAQKPGAIQGSGRAPGKE